MITLVGQQPKISENKKTKFLSISSKRKVKQSPLDDEIEK